MQLTELTDTKALKRFQSKHSKAIAVQSRRIHFNKEEIDCLIQIYFQHIENAGTTRMNRIQFHAMLTDVFGLYDSYLFDRISLVVDKTQYGLSLEEFLDAMSVFVRGTLQERIDYCFRVYDVVGDGFIKRDTMLYLLKNGMYKHVKEEVEESVKDYADRLMKKVDLDRDGMISYNDFCESVKLNPTLMEMMGVCLPDRASLYSFLFTFTSNLSKH